MKLRYWDLRPTNSLVVLGCELEGRWKRRHQNSWQRDAIRIVITKIRNVRRLEAEHQAYMNTKRTNEIKGQIDSALSECGPSGLVDVYELIDGYLELCRRKSTRRLRFCLWVAKKVLR